MQTKLASRGKQDYLFPMHLALKTMKLSKGSSPFFPTSPSLTPKKGKQKKTSHVWLARTESLVHLNQLLARIDLEYSWRCVIWDN